MPTYCYRTDDGRTIERRYPIGKAPDSILRGGQVAWRDFQAEHGKRRAVASPWPLHSYACAVRPEEIPGAQANLASKGVQADFDSNGLMIFESRSHRRKVCQALGLVDRDGGYSD